MGMLSFQPLLGATGRKSSFRSKSDDDISPCSAISFERGYPDETCGFYKEEMILMVSSLKFTHF